MAEYNPLEEMELTAEMFNNALVRLNKKHPGKYLFLLRGGQSLKEALFVLMQSVWTSETIPNG